MKKIMIIFAIAVLLFPVTGFYSVQFSYANEIIILPSSFSWRDINGIDYTTPIKDQSPAPTCEAFAFCAALETKMQYKLKELYQPDLSENHLYFYAGGTIEKGYVNMIDAAHYLIEYGVPDEGCYPDPHRSEDYSFESLPGWQNRTVKITEWGWVDHNITTMKQALIDHGPLLICISVWQDFFWYQKGVYSHRWGPPVGGHVVSIVGYDDNQQCWIVKNSWGTKWGEDGWFRMNYNADMIAEWYGPDTGVMYIDGVFGNLHPDVPKVHIETPVYYHTYFFNRGFSTIVKKLPLKIAAARILGPLTVSVKAEQANSIEFYLDDVLKYIDLEPPFYWEFEASRGFHTLTAKATNNNNISSIDMIDIYKIL